MPSQFVLKIMSFQRQSEVIFGKTIGRLISSTHGSIKYLNYDKQTLYLNVNWYPQHQSGIRRPK